MKVVQYLVKEVNQFPSDIECMRYIATIADKVNVEFVLDGTLFQPLGPNQITRTFDLFLILFGSISKFLHSLFLTQV